MTEFRTRHQCHSSRRLRKLWPSRRLRHSDGCPQSPAGHDENTFGQSFDVLARHWRVGCPEDTLSPKFEDLSLLILSAVRSGSLPPQSKLPYATPQGESNVTRRRNKTVGLASAAAQRVTPPAAAAVQPNVLRRSETPMRNTVPVRPERFAVIAGVTTFPRFTELWCLWTGVPSWQRLCERYLPRVPPGVY